MYFGLSEEQSFFQDNVRKYLEEHATIDNIKHIASGDEKNLSAEIHQGLLNLGINGLLIPEEFGGLGLDFALCSCCFRSFREVEWALLHLLHPMLWHQQLLSMQVVKLSKKIIFLKLPLMNIVLELGLVNSLAKEMMLE
jgi:alkylation response protein AidB-like acyl-CoA dehydrogenase